MKRLMMIAAALCLLGTACTKQAQHPFLDAEKPLAVWMAESEMARNPSPAQIDFIPVGKIKWNYTTGLELLAMMEAAKEYDRSDFDAYALRYYDSIVQPDGSVISYTKERYNIDHICPGRPLFEIAEKTGEERYKQVLQTLWEQLHEHPRNPDGGFWHKKVYTRQMWLDGIYMGEPFYAEYVMRNVMPYDEEKGKAYVADIVNQFTTIARHTYDPASGLFRHAYDDAREQFWCDKTTGQSAHAWGRAMGWYTMAIVETLQYLGVTEQTEPMVKILNHILETLPRHANPESGMWYQVMDSSTREGNYEEATGSIMVIYTMMKAARLGIIAPEYQAKGVELFEKFVDRFLKLEEDGTISITNCCAVAGLGGSGMRSGTYDYYLSEPIRDNDPKATGPFIWAAMEYDRAKRN